MWPCVSGSGLVGWEEEKIPLALWRLLEHTRRNLSWTALSKLELDGLKENDIYAAAWRDDKIFQQRSVTCKDIRKIHIMNQARARIRLTCDDIRNSKSAYICKRDHDIHGWLCPNIGKKCLRCKSDKHVVIVCSELAKHNWAEAQWFASVINLLNDWSQKCIQNAAIFYS